MIFTIQTNDEVAGLDITLTLMNAGIQHTILSKQHDKHVEQSTYQMNEYIKALERVARAAKIIFDVSDVAFSRTKSKVCPHGNCPSNSTHAWWCDKCFWELEAALQDLESFQSASQIEP